ASSKSVTLKLVDNSDGACVLDSSQANYCSAACTGKTAITGGSQTLTFASGATDKGQKQSTSFTINTAYRNLVAIMGDGTTTACSTDAFSIRPTSITSVSSSDATNTTTSGTPIFKAGSDSFTLVATTAGVAGNPGGYTGNLKINSAKIQSTASVTGALTPLVFPASVSNTASSTATGATFKYSEVGGFQITGGYNPATDTSSPRGVYDGVDMATECTGSTAACDTIRQSTWTGVDSISSKGDCIVGTANTTPPYIDSYSNTKDASGKYGCNFGNVASSVAIGRFVPDHFSLSAASLTNRNELTCTAPNFSYMEEPIQAQFTLTAQNAANATTQNYTGVLAKLDLNTPANFALGAVDSYYGSTPYAITKITKANPGVVTTSVATGYTTGDKVLLRGVQGMVEVNNTIVTITVVDATHFSIAVDTSTYTPYASGGIALKKAVPGTDLTARLTLDSSSGSWSSGVTRNGLLSTMSLIFHVGRLVSGPDGGYRMELGIAPVDSDGVKLSPFDLDVSAPIGNDHGSIGTTYVYYGRLGISNGYGTELLGLPVKVQAQYWDWATGSYVSNSDDSCTPLNAGNFMLTQSAGATITTTVTGGGTMAGGVGTIKLNKPNPTPGGKGSVILKTNPAATPSPIDTYLPGSAIETFGIYKAGPVIYLREIYN
ncbi:MAG: DUF6701 domain-containing protein, partial [Burkholderiaceae bacterium]